MFKKKNIQLGTLVYIRKASPHECSFCVWKWCECPHLSAEMSSDLRQHFFQIPCVFLVYFHIVSSFHMYFPNPKIWQSSNFQHISHVVFPYIFLILSWYVPHMFSYFPVFFLSASHDFSNLSLIVSSHFSHDFPMIFPWFSHDFPMISHDLPWFTMIFPWFPLFFPMGKSPRLSSGPSKPWISATARATRSCAWEPRAGCAWRCRQSEQWR